MQQDFVCAPLFAGKYRLLDIIGSGAYGTVYSALNQHGQLVAIKQLLPFNLDQSHVYVRRCLREIRLLKFLRDHPHPNVIKLLTVFQETDSSSKPIINIVMEKMDCDLHKIIRIQELTNDHVKYFTYQILNGLLFLHNQHIIHRDLKPSNIFVNSNCDLRIGDFGLATTEIETFTKDNNVSVRERKFTDYIQTRWYRAPETLMQQSYTKAVDMWSLGCIIAEMIIRCPLMPGKNTIDQLLLNLDMCGSQFQFDCKNETLQAELSNRLIINAKKTVHGYILENYPREYNMYPTQVWDLVEALLDCDQGKRLSASQALFHPYLYHEMPNGRSEEDNGPSTSASSSYSSQCEPANLDILRSIIIDEMD